MKYECVKKPVTVYAVQWTGNNFDEIKDFCGTIELHGRIGPYETIGGPVDVAYMSTAQDMNTGTLIINDLMIRTLEGDHKAELGAYIIKGVRGECYPCKREIFEETYNFKECK